METVQVPGGFHYRKDDVSFARNEEDSFRLATDGPSDFVEDTIVHDISSVSSMYIRVGIWVSHGLCFKADEVPFRPAS